MAKTILMCPPTYFEVGYAINPWMHPDSAPADQALAGKQWQALYDIYTQKLGWDVVTIAPVRGLPDMVFATDNCLMLGGRILLSHFRFKERRPEAAHFGKWFAEQGYSEMLPARNFFEGGGETIPWGKRLLAGYGFRSSLEAHDELRAIFSREVISLRLIDPYFYHLDTAIAALDATTLAYYPPAFDEPSLARLRATGATLIEVSRDEASSFGLNVVVDDRTLITGDIPGSLQQKYEDQGFKVIQTPIGEFLKAGGGVKCMTLELR